MHFAPLNAQYLQILCYSFIGTIVLPHFEYCDSLLMGIGKKLNKKLEDANYYCLQTVMSIGKSTDYESVVRMLDMNTLIHEYSVQAM